MTDPETTDPNLRLDILEAREDRPWRWPIVSAFLFSFLSTALAIGLCLQVSERNSQRGIAQRQQLQEQSRQQHDALCGLIISLDDNARADEPTTELGISNAKTYASLRITQGCPPPSKGN